MKTPSGQPFSDSFLYPATAFVWHWVCHRRKNHCWRAVAISAVMTIGAAADVRVIPVPYRADDPSLPHPAYNGHPTTFKAIARTANVTDQVYFRWDVDGDGNWDLDLDRTVTPGQGRWYRDNVFNLGFRKTLPNLDPAVATLKRFNAIIQVAASIDAAGNNPVGDSFFNAYPVLVFAGLPLSGTDGLPRPQDATSAQLKVMEAVALDDALWRAHVSTGTRSGNGAAITAVFSPGNQAAAGPTAAAFVRLAAQLGHFPAYPYATYDHNINTGGYRPPVPNAEWFTRNDQRYALDPYAETALRALNVLLSSLSPTTLTDVLDEGDDGTTPLQDTNDSVGLTSPTMLTEIVCMDGAVLAALAHSDLVGTVAQIGNTAHVLGRSIESIGQQIVDRVVADQIDATGSNFGGWPATPGTTGPAVARTSIWQTMGLRAATARLGDAGVYVNKRVRDRLQYYLLSAQSSANDQARWYTWSTRGELALSGGLLCAAGLTGASTFASDDPDVVGDGLYSPSVTKGQVRLGHDKYVAAIGRDWVSEQTNEYGYFSGLFSNDGGTNPTPYLRTDKRGSTEAIFLMTQGFGSLPLAARPQVVNGHDWHRECSTYLLRNQYADGRWEDSAWATSVAYYTGKELTTLLGGLALAVHLDGNEAPIAVATATSNSAYAGENVSFDGSQSWDAENGTLLTYQWNFGDGSTAATTINPVHAFNTVGQFVITLQVSDAQGSTTTTNLSIDVTLRPNQPPIAEAGPDQAAYPSHAVQLEGKAADPNGDSIVSWQWTVVAAPTGSLPQLSDATIANPIFSSPTFGTYILSLAASDGTAWGNADQMTVEITNSLYPPIAQPGGPYITVRGLAVHLDASASHDPDPEDSVVGYFWDLDDDGFYDDATGVSVDVLNPNWQTGSMYRVALKVVDSVGKISDLVETTISVSEPREPTITKQPVSVVVLAGAPATFTVEATGIPSPTFHWRKQGVEIQDATKATLVIANTQPEDAGVYDVVVTNFVRSVTSTVATLNVRITYAAWALAHDVVGGPEADPDADTLKNLQEFAFGTNPKTVTGSIGIDENGNVTNPRGTPVPYLYGITAETVDFRAIFSRRKDYQDFGLNYTLQFSAGLDVWIDYPFGQDEPISMEGDSEIEAVYVPYPLIIQTANGFEKPRFFRVGVDSSSQ